MLVFHGAIMQFGKLLILLVILSLFYIANSNGKVNHPKEPWLELCPNNQFCFKHPKSLTPDNVLSIDSIAGQLNSDNITLSYDLGMYSSQFNEFIQATSEPIIIDGLHGKFFIEKNKMALVIPQVQGKLRFSMLIKFKNNVDEKQGLTIFKSITFNLNS